MSMFALGIFLIFMGLLYFLYQKIPNKAVFFAFVLILITSAGFAGYSVYTPHKNSQEADLIAREKIVAQQHIFGEWYTNYQKDIDSLDYIWQQYNQILINLKNDDISTTTAFTRMSQLEVDSARLKNSIEQSTPPATLNDDNYALVNKIYHKTLDYANAQLRTISLSKSTIEASKQQTLSNNELPPADTSNKENSPNNTEAAQTPQQADLSHKLSKIKLVEAPACLFTATEISTLRANLTLPEEKINEEAATEAPQGDNHE